MMNVPAPNQALPIAPPVLNIHAYRMVSERCNQIKHGTKLLTMYTRLAEEFSLIRPRIEHGHARREDRADVALCGQMLQYSIEGCY